MQRHELDLSVGDVFHVGETTVTVIDIDGEEVTFRVDDASSHDDDQTNGMSDSPTNKVPR